MITLPPASQLDSSEIMRMLIVEFFEVFEAGEVSTFYPPEAPSTGDQPDQG
jgi:hypothetical protein